MSDGEKEVKRIPDATVARLPIYLRSLLELSADTLTVSSEQLADSAGVNAAKVRKDLSYLGSYGTRGVGYDVEYLQGQMRRALGLTHDWPVVIVFVSVVSGRTVRAGYLAKRDGIAGIGEIGECRAEQDQPVHQLHVGVARPGIVVPTILDRAGAEAPELHEPGHDVAGPLTHGGGKAHRVHRAGSGALIGAAATIIQRDT